MTKDYDDFKERYEQKIRDELQDEQGSGQTMTQDY